MNEDQEGKEIYFLYELARIRLTVSIFSSVQWSEIRFGNNHIVKSL